jgi:ribose 5-phosphate isomerase A
LRTQNEKKRIVAEQAMRFVHEDSVIGIGTGSTVAFFVEALKHHKLQLRGAVSSSAATSLLLREAGIPEIELNVAGDLDLCVDGADEATRDGMLIKGGGGALTREKIIAAASKTFVCLIDDTKLVAALGRFPLPVEVIPMARSYVARQLVKLGGRPVWRENIVSDNGNAILDVHHIPIGDPLSLESRIDAIAGVVCVGLFAKRGADVLMVGAEDGVLTIEITAEAI